MHQNTKAIVIATWVGIIVNIFLTVLKGIGGMMTGSRALLADALHSASDIAGSIVILFAVKIANKPPDAEHPYGHGKAEDIASIIVSLLLIVVGIEISISSIKVFFGDIPAAPGKMALIILIISILIKEALFHYKLWLGKKYRSTALVSEAWHHRSDAFSSLAALAGVVLALLGAYFHVPFLIYGDALAGIVVSIIVIKVGYQLARDSFNVVLEKVLANEDIKAYEKTVHAIDGVLRIDQLLARTHGRYVIIDIKISVDPTITVQHGHSIAARTKVALIQQHTEVEDVLVHVNPYEEHPTT
jgi:cation diffusion facilitator family transporter